MNNFLKRFIQGIVLGVALITTIGGGTVAVLLGVYDDIINSVADFRKNPRESLRLIIPMGIGGVVGIGVFILPIMLLLDHFRFPTLAFFVGLTIGGLHVFKDIVKGNIKLINIIHLIVGFIFVFSIGLFTWLMDFKADLSTINVIQFVLLFVVAFISMGGHVSPGISGTLLLFAFGYFEEVVNLFKRFILLQSNLFWNDFFAILVFVIGSFLGLIAIAKIYKKSFEKSREKTSFTILGFIIGSLIIIFFNGEIKLEYSDPIYQSFNVWQFVISIALVVTGAVISSLLFKYVERHKKQVEEKEDAEIMGE